MPHLGCSFTNSQIYLKVKRGFSFTFTPSLPLLKIFLSDMTSQSSLQILLFNRHKNRVVKAKSKPSTTFSEELGLKEYMKLKACPMPETGKWQILQSKTLEESCLNLHGMHCSKENTFKAVFHIYQNLLDVKQIFRTVQHVISIWYHQYLSFPRSLIDMDAPWRLSAVKCHYLVFAGVLLLERSSGKTYLFSFPTMFLCLWRLEPNNSVI